MTTTATFSNLNHSIVTSSISGIEWHGVPYAAILARDGQIATQVAEWIDAGNVIAPFQAPALSADDYAIAIQSHIDATAKAKGYADGVGLASYTVSTNPAWASEATLFVAWRDAVWAYAYAVLGDVQSGLRPAPTIAGLIAELPGIVWP